MKEFILLIWVPLNYSTEKAREVNPAWDRVTTQWKTEKIFVQSFVFPRESRLLTGAERTSKPGPTVSEGRKIVSAIIIRAESLEKAVELAKQAPVLDHGGSVEVREVPAR